MKIKYRIRQYYPPGTIIEGTFGGVKQRTIYRNRLDSSGYLIWSEEPDNVKGKMGHSWPMKEIKVIKMGNESKMEKEGYRAYLEN